METTHGLGGQRIRLRTYLYGEFRSLGMDYIPTEANFIYIILAENTSSQIYTTLLKQGIIVRPMGPDAVRITIGLPGENKRLVEALKNIR